MDFAYSVCRTIARRSGSTFYYGMRMLPPPKRNAMYAVYAWSRIADDAVDEAAGAEAERRLREAATVLERALGPGYQRDPEPVVQALGDSIRRYRLPEAPFRGLIEGMAMDLHPRPFATAEDTLRYCERVAGTVGVLSLHIFGYTDPAAPGLAVEMGIALQLTNMLRDLADDVRQGRIYLPDEDLMRFHYPREDLLRLKPSPSFYRLFAFEVERARSYYTRARPLLDLVDPDSRRCIRLLYGLYRELLAKVASRPEEVLRARVRMSTAEKLRLVGSLLWSRRAIS